MLCECVYVCESVYVCECVRESVCHKWPACLRCHGDGWRGDVGQGVSQLTPQECVTDLSFPLGAPVAPSGGLPSGPGKVAPGHPGSHR